MAFEASYRRGSLIEINVRRYGAGARVCSKDQSAVRSAPDSLKRSTVASGRGVSPPSPETLRDGRRIALQHAAPAAWAPSRGRERVGAGRPPADRTRRLVGRVAVAAH